LSNSWQIYRQNYLNRFQSTLNLLSALNASMATPSYKFINKLQGKRVLIFGGTSGIRFTVAEACVEHGVRNNGMVAREPLGPAKLSCIYMVFPPYLTLSSASSVRNIHSSLYPYTIAFICINHSAPVYAHILNTW